MSDCGGLFNIRPGMGTVRTKLRYNLFLRGCPSLSVISFKPALHNIRSPSRHVLVPAMSGF